MLAIVRTHAIPKKEQQRARTSPHPLYETLIFLWKKCSILISEKGLMKV